MDVVASAGLIDWEHLTGQSKFVIDLVSVPIFSAIAGLITNWTGVIMLFSPARFTAFCTRASDARAYSDRPPTRIGNVSRSIETRRPPGLASRTEGSST